MSFQKSPLYTVIAVVLGLIAIVSGASQMYKGFSSSTQNRKIDELLTKSDESITAANNQLVAVVPAFQKILGDFDSLGTAAFRAEKRGDCEKIIKEFSLVSGHLQEASKLLKDAMQLGTDEKTTSFLVEKAKSYELLVQVNDKNVEIVQTTLDESITEASVVVEKILELASSRDEIQKTADAATAAADAILKKE